MNKEQKNEMLQKRWQLLRTTREFFWSHGYTEVETPHLLEYPGQEPYLDPIEVKFHDDRKQEYTAYLHTSPEYAMKKMLANGSGNIFSLGKVFRDYESMGGLHNIEFTLLEFYHVDADMFALMDMVKRLIITLSDKGVKFQRTSMKQLWKEQIGVNLDDYLDQISMKQLCAQRGYETAKGESYEDLFYRIFLNEIEPHFSKDAFTFVYDYPAAMAALARLGSDHRYASRFELYHGSLELGNGFHELNDRSEQQRRFEDEQGLREKLSKKVFPIDQEFILAVSNLPNCSGIAIGFDRLVMALLGCQNIEDVIPSVTYKHPSVWT